MVVTDTTVELTREEIIAQLEEGAQRRRGISARELLSAYRAGRLDQPGDVLDLLGLAWLLPEDDPLFADAR